MARTKGSKNASTKIREQVRQKGIEEIKNKAETKPRVVIPCGIVTIDSNFRYKLDPNCFVLQRKYKPGEKVEQDPNEDGVVELIDDEEVLVTDQTTEKDKDRWGNNKYFSKSKSGLLHMLEHIVHYYTDEKLLKKTVPIGEYISTIKNYESELYSIIMK
jgi:hypothetical protein